MNAKIRILIVDDHSMVRLALAQAIERNSDLCLVGEAANGNDALSLYRELRPDVVTMDFKLPDRDGDEVIAAIRAEFPDVKAVLLSIFEDAESIWRATQAGALGYVSKAAEIDELVAAIRQVAGGTPYYSAGLAEKLAQRSEQEDLTPRELEVLHHLVSGRSNKEIVNEMRLSISTVKHHLENIFIKLKVCDRTQAVTVALQRGIVRLSE
jgi:two-component system NarL family response regulator